ncbi:nuclear transport factor 2 family protein [Epibacterium ulvae]|uniref:nuclear transport factor 2 family protein n=1 Tax=Epibacterium ulvae TaxID=1156985 RepID=UPI001BFCCE74|nr:nuclear transport factor 2 family protein [Epibacterium ulvae]MBT8154253.1 nuclear transport factor 2 family protein [Epibacterium ulvae]
MTHFIDRFFVALMSPEGAAHMIADDAKIIAVREARYEALPLYGTYTGPDGFTAFFNELRRIFDTQLFEVDHTMADAARGFAAGRFIHRVRATDKLFHSHWTLYAEFTGDKLTLYRFYEDTAALEETNGVRTQSQEHVA